MQNNTFSLIVLQKKKNGYIGTYIIIIIQPTYIHILKLATISLLNTKSKKIIYRIRKLSTINSLFATIMVRKCVFIKKKLFLALIYAGI